MRKFILMMALVTLSNNAAAEWSVVGAADNVTAYVDLATVKRQGDLVKMYSLNDYKTVKNEHGYVFMSEKGLSEYDCKEKEQRTLVFTGFSGNMGSGRVVYSDDGNWGVYPGWYPIERGSLGEKAWKIACGS